MCICWFVIMLGCFFCKQKTAYEMRISDWSSDVCSSDLAVDQDRLGRAADSGAAHLGVDREADRLRRIGGAVDIEMVDAVEMREHGHARFVLHARDEALAAARDDDVDQPLRAEHCADRGAVLRDRKSTRLNSSH